MNAILIAFVFVSVGVLPVVADDVQFRLGSTAVARDPSGSVLGADTTANLDKLLMYVRDQDRDGIKQMIVEGHAFRLRNGSQVKILLFNPREHAYRVHVVGADKEIWLIKEHLSAQ